MKLHAKQPHICVVYKTIRDGILIKQTPFLKEVRIQNKTSSLMETQKRFYKYALTFGMIIPYKGAYAYIIKAGIVFAEIINCSS